MAARVSAPGTTEGNSGSMYTPPGLLMRPRSMFSDMPAMTGAAPRPWPKGEPVTTRGALAEARVLAMAARVSGATPVARLTSSGPKPPLTTALKVSNPGALLVAPALSRCQAMPSATTPRSAAAAGTHWSHTAAVLLRLGPTYT